MQFIWDRSITEQLTTTGVPFSTLHQSMLKKKGIYDVLKAYWLRGKLDRESYTSVGGTMEYLKAIELVQEQIQDENELLLLLRLYGWDLEDTNRSVTTPLYIPVIPAVRHVIPYSFCIDDVEYYNTSEGDVLFVLPSSMMMDSERIPSGESLIWSYGDAQRVWNVTGGGREIRVTATSVRRTRHVISFDRVLPLGVVASDFTPRVPVTNVTRVGDGIQSNEPLTLSTKRGEKLIKVEWKSVQMDEWYSFLKPREGHIINTLLLQQFSRLIMLDAACTIFEDLIFEGLLRIDRRVMSSDTEENVQLMTRYPSNPDSYSRVILSKIPHIRQLHLEYRVLKEMSKS